MCRNSSLCSSAVIMCLMLRLPPGPSRTDSLFPAPTLFPAFRRRFRREGAALQPLRCRGRIQRGPIQRGRVVVEPFHIEEQGRERRLVGSVRERSEEHTSELQSLMRSPYAVFCSKTKNSHPQRPHSGESVHTHSNTDDG